MFTGLIEELGIISSIKKNSLGISLNINANIVLEDVKIGDSIAVNGICLTVEKFTNNSFEVFASAETMSKTTLKILNNGQKVNLERALTLSQRLGGHLVYGHIDGTGNFVSEKIEGKSIRRTFTVPENLLGQIVDKGSITIDGISLTVVIVKNNLVETALIPETIKLTNMALIKPGDKVNIETDIIGKYIEKLVAGKKSNFSFDTLAKAGF